MNATEPTITITAETTLRPTLGDMNSIVCFRALVVGIEKTMGVAAANVTLRAAGRARGQGLVGDLGLTGAGPEDPSEAATLLTAALGADGTRLCKVDKVTRDGDTWRVYAAETICSAGEAPGSSRELSFTFGALHGAIEALYGIKLRGKQVGSVLRGDDHDIIELVPR